MRTRAPAASKVSETTSAQATGPPWAAPRARLVEEIDAHDRPRACARSLGQESLGQGGVGLCALARPQCLRGAVRADGLAGDQQLAQLEPRRQGAAGAD